MKPTSFRFSSYFRRAVEDRMKVLDRSLKSYVVWAIFTADPECKRLTEQYEKEAK